MAKTIDVYKEWLGIEETARPLNYYQLLKLKQFEDDTAAIRASYRKLNALVRTYATGEYGPRSQELLNELARAMLCLTDEVRKREYDASLGRTAAAAAGRRTLEELLVARKVLSTADLDKARRFAKTIGVEIRDAIMQQRLAPPDQVMQAYAESEGLPYVDLTEVAIDENLIPRVPATLARQHSCAPLMVDDGRLLVISPNPLLPEVEDQLRLRLDLPVRTVLCTPAAIHEVINKYYPRSAAAAEMAGAPPPRPAPTPAAAATQTASTTAAQTASAPVAQAPPAKQTPASSEEARKERLLYTIVAFNFTFFGWVLLTSSMFHVNLLMKWGPAAVLATAVAALVWWLKS